MDKYILNEMYPLSSGFGTEDRKTIIELTKDNFPNLDEKTRRDMVIYIEKTREEINDYFFKRYDYKNDANSATVNTLLQKNGHEWIKQNYPWMNEDNIQSSASEGMYFGWHG